MAVALLHRDLAGEVTSESPIAWPRCTVDMRFTATCRPPASSGALQRPNRALDRLSKAAALAAHHGRLTEIALRHWRRGQTLLDLLDPFEALAAMSRLCSGTSSMFWLSRP